jgi:Bifunctional DNA primase/polymerase, N-terminal
MDPESGMSDPVTRDLDVARILTNAGVPVFLAYPDASKPTGYSLPLRWETTAADPAYIDAWKPGMAVCAVMGHLFDVLDVDPRHGGGESAAGLRDELAGVMPRVYGKTGTPSGGWHYWLAPLGIGKHTGFRAGLDLQGGKPDGSGRGLVFIPPTIRASKIDGVRRAYTWLQPPSAPPAVDKSGAQLAQLVLRAAEPVRQPAAGGPGRRVAGVSGRYMLAAVEAELERVATAAEGDRHEVIRSASYALGRFVAAGLLDAGVTEDALMTAAGLAGVPFGERKARETIRGGFRLRSTAS